MAEQDLDKLLRALRTELSRADLSDPRSRELAEHLLAEADELAERRAAGTAPTVPTLVSRLRSAVEHFEGTHPTLTETMNRIVRALADAGL